MLRKIIATKTHRDDGASGIMGNVNKVDSFVCESRNARVSVFPDGAISFFDVHWCAFIVIEPNGDTKSQGLAGVIGSPMVTNDGTQIVLVSEHNLVCLDRNTLDIVSKSRIPRFFADYFDVGFFANGNMFMGGGYGKGVYLYDFASKAVLRHHEISWIKGLGGARSGMTGMSLDREFVYFLKADADFQSYKLMSMDQKGELSLVDTGESHHGFVLDRDCKKLYFVRAHYFTKRYPVPNFKVLSLHELRGAELVVCKFSFKARSLYNVSILAINNEQVIIQDDDEVYAVKLGGDLRSSEVCWKYLRKECSSGMSAIFQDGMVYLFSRGGDFVVLNGDDGVVVHEEKLAAEIISAYFDGENGRIIVSTKKDFFVKNNEREIIELSRFRILRFKGLDERGGTGVSDSVVKPEVKVAERSLVGE
jgi:hypothetical protein